MVPATSLDTYDPPSMNMLGLKNISSRENNKKVEKWIKKLKKKCLMGLGIGVLKLFWR